jgi:TPP-dependent pyruvate/acetoin dehydrogenase alpha subunit
MQEIRPDILETLLTIRRVDEKLIELYPTDKIKSPVHLSIGQEGCAIACFPLRKEDAVFGSYRSHALYIAKGGDLNRFFAEMYGKVTGCCKGKGGSMHLCDPEAGVMGTSAVVASTIPEAVGWAYAAKLQQQNKVSLVFFGDGATDEGVFYECISYANLQRLPVIFVCENNGLAIHSRVSQRSTRDRVIERLSSHVSNNMDLFRVKSFEVEEIYSLVERSRQEILDNPHPTFIEIETYRLYEHVGIKTDWHLGYRKEEEAKEFVELDPLRFFEYKKLPTWLEEMKQRVDKKIEDAVKFAEESDFPSPEELYKDIF